MKIFNATLVLIIFSIGTAGDDPMHATFKYTDLYTAKLTIARLNQAINSGSVPMIKNKIASVYSEDGLAYSKSECTSLIENIWEKMDSLRVVTANDIRTFYTINEIDRQGDIVIAKIKIALRFVFNDEATTSEDTVELKLTRNGGSWQVSESDGWLAKMVALTSKTLIESKQQRIQYDQNPDDLKSKINNQDTIEDNAEKMAKEISHE